MPFSSRIDAKVLGVRSFHAMGCLRFGKWAWSALGLAPVWDSDGKTRRVVPWEYTSQAGTAIRARERSARFRALREALRVRDPPRAHRIEQRRGARSAH